MGNAVWFTLQGLRVRARDGFLTVSVEGSGFGDLVIKELGSCDHHEDVLKIYR